GGAEVTSLAALAAATLVGTSLIDELAKRADWRVWNPFLVQEMIERTGRRVDGRSSRHIPPPPFWSAEIRTSLVLDTATAQDLTTPRLVSAPAAMELPGDVRDAST